MRLPGFQNHDLEEVAVKSLQGMTAVISGGGSGIGREAALELARQRVRVLICGRRLDALEETAALAENGQILPVQADVSNELDVEQVMTVVRELSGRLDILINNAGIGGGGPIHEHSIEEWDQILAVNLRGPFLLSRAALPMMRDQGGGHIINISSESGLEYYPEDGAYGVSKHALNALGEYIQRENQDFNIRMNTICPGMVVTEMTDHYTDLDRSKCLYPADIAELIIWLVSRRDNIKIGRPVLIQTMENPWE
jgi:NAD(P)-dependent dehydrogenase (short-subunit alcohol dehydrogenase family)